MTTSVRKLPSKTPCIRALDKGPLGKQIIISREAWSRVRVGLEIQLAYVGIAQIGNSSPGENRSIFNDHLVNKCISHMLLTLNRCEKMNKY
jgi:hypothetical protein